MSIFRSISELGRPRSRCVAALALAAGLASPVLHAADPVPTDLAEYHESTGPFLERFCIRCHEGEDAKADFRLDDIDPMITGGGDIERWEKALEMISIGDMPPPEKKQPAKAVRREVETWILAELRKVGRGPDESRLNRPEFGNRVDHEDLFSGEHTGPASSPPRLWRKNRYIYQRFIRQQRLGHGGGNPFAPLAGHGFKDYGQLYASESTILSLRNNADAFIAEILDGRLVHPRGPDGKEDRSRRVREGKSRYSEFNALAHDGAEPSDERIAAAVERAFILLLGRRPDEQEQSRYGEVYLRKAIEIGGGKDGLKSLFTALVLSPEFVYRQEIGLGEELPDGRRMLSPEEIAYAVAYALTDSPPDGELRKALEAGQLSTRDDVEREVRRILATSTRKYWGSELTSVEGYIENCPNPRVLRFFREFFGYQKVFDVFKDKARNPNHKALFIFKDADGFVLSILEEDRQVLRQLLTSDRYLVHYIHPEHAQKKLDQLVDKKDKRAMEKIARGLTPILGHYRGQNYFTTYGYDRDTWDFPVEQPAPVPNRAGMLTHPAWLVAHSGNFDTDPIRRGKWIREHLLADTIPDIPIGVDAKVPEDPHRTLRERLELVREEQCWRCHKKMNPLGEPFEAFDDFGRFRDRFYFDEEGKLAGTYFEREQAIAAGKRRGATPVNYPTTRPVDTSGELTGTGDPQLDGEVADAFELVDRLARSERVRQSFVRHAFRYWMGRNETLDDSPTLMAADKAYVDGGGSFKELLVSLLTSDSFLTRKDPDR